MNRDNPTAAAGAGIPTEDTELVRQIASAAPGQASEAEAELYRRMAPRVRLYGIRHLRDEKAAQDLAHEVLLIVFEALRAGRLREPEIRFFRAGAHVVRHDNISIHSEPVLAPNALQAEFEGLSSFWSSQEVATQEKPSAALEF